MNQNENNETEDLSLYEIQSRREIVSVMRRILEGNQLVRMQTGSGEDCVITSLLQIDETGGTVVVGAAPDGFVNKRILASDTLSFETALDSIRILFFASNIESCAYENRSALRMSLPTNLIRVQRREYYRVLTPMTNPVRCTIPVPNESARTPRQVVVAAYNVSAGGIGITDEKNLINPELGSVYENCRIDLPIGPVAVTLQIRNSQEIALASGKTIRRHGCMFVEPSPQAAAAIQRYITKLEREQNARATGMA